MVLGNIRNLIFEQILEKMAHKCKFSDFGCTYQETIELLEIHEKDCCYRLVNCSDLDCKKQVSMVQLLEHMRKEGHKPREFPNQRQIKRYLSVKDKDFEQDNIWREDHITIKDQHFFGQCWRSTGGQWALWVFMLGSRADCEKQAYTIKLKSHEGKRKEELIYRGYCAPLDMTKEQVASTGNCLTLTDAAVKRLKVNDGFKYSITIESAE